MLDTLVLYAPLFESIKEVFAYVYPSTGMVTFREVVLLCFTHLIVTKS